MADVPPKPDGAAPPALQFSMDDAVASGVYANFVNIIHNPAEFVFDFARTVPGRADVRILSRILTTPVHAKQFLNALAQNVAIYEKNFGAIRLDFDPPRPDGGGVRPN